jgi:hypothetical protein
LDSASFIVDDQFDSSCDFQQHVLRQHRQYLSKFLGALVEAGREFEVTPADEWEAGQLLALYGAVNEAAAYVHAIRAQERPEAVPKTKAQLKEFAARSLRNRRLRFQRRRLLMKLLGDVRHICDVVVARHWPEAQSRLQTEIEDNSPQKTERLNDAVHKIGLFQIPRLHDVVEVWLTSFDKLHGGGHYGRNLYLVDLNTVSQWIEASQAAVRQTLSRAGPTVRKMTIEM